MKEPPANQLRWSKHLDRYYLECERFGWAFIDRIPHPTANRWEWWPSVYGVDLLPSFRTLREAKAWAEKAVDSLRTRKKFNPPTVNWTVSDLLRYERTKR